MGSVVGWWGGWLFQTRPIPRSPDGDNNLGHILGELDFNSFFEQVTPSRSSGESLGADLPPPRLPPPKVIKGPKSARFYRVNMRKLNL